MAADALADLPHWHQPGQIVTQSRLGVARWIPMHPVDPGSTALRHRNSGDVHGDVPRAAPNYIRTKSLTAGRAPPFAD